MAEQQEVIKDTQQEALPPLENIYFLMIKIISATDLERADLMGSSDPFCKIIAKKQSYKTKHIEKDLNPQWNEETSFVFFDAVEEIKFEVYDHDQGSKHDLIGQCTLETKMFYNQDNKGYQGSIELQDCKKGSIKVDVTGRKVSPLELEQRCGSLEVETTKQAEVIQKKNEECNALMAKNGELEETRQDLLKQQNDLNTQLNQLRDQIAQQKQLNAEKQQKIDGLQKNKNKLQDSIKKKEGDLARKQQEMEQEQQKLQAAKDQYKSLQEQSNKYRDEQGYKPKDIPSASSKSSKKGDGLQEALINPEDNKY